MKYLKTLCMGLLLILVAIMATLFYQFNNVPSLAPYQAYFSATSTSASHSFSKQNGPQNITATYVGTSTILISDGQTSIMSDGFFTRPSFWELMFGEIMPNKALIKEALLEVDAHNLAAVIPVHSHHDHAMDAPEVAKQTGAMLVGSKSSANIARGWGLDEKQIKVLPPQQVLQFGEFKVRLIASEHAAAPEFIEKLTGAGQTINNPVKFPATLSDFKEGGSYSIFIEHPLGNVLIQGSAGFKEGALKGIKADVVFLGMGGLGKKPASYQQEYFNEVVSRVGATRVIPIHWDDFTRAFHKPLQPMINAADDFDGAMNFLIDKTQNNKALSLHMMGKLDTLQLYGR
jgi:L-ascorbate metabolism protein UlaG (beta-lactamase superfamily)